MGIANNPNRCLEVMASWPAWKREYQVVKYAKNKAAAYDYAAATTSKIHSEFLLVDGVIPTEFSITDLRNVRYRGVNFSVVVEGQSVIVSSGSFGLLSPKQAVSIVNYLKATDATQASL